MKFELFPLSGSEALNEKKEKKREEEKSELSTNVDDDSSFRRSDNAAFLLRERTDKKARLNMSDDFVYVGTPLEAVAAKPQQQQGRGWAGQQRRGDGNRQTMIDGRRK